MWCEKEGRDPATIERNVNLSFHMAATAKDLPAVEAQYQETWPTTADAMRSRGVLVGLPADAIERIGQYRDAGAARVNIAIRPPANWDALHAFAAEVIPALV